MMFPPATIIITNYNYAAFLRPAIESALNQCGAGDVEVIVVDDGSTDDSQRIIAEFGNRIIPVLKSNGGQASAFNAGFARSSGRVVLFLDADDLLLESAIERSAEVLSDARASKVHWPLRVIDTEGRFNGRLHPSTKLPEGDFLDELIEQGPWMCETPPTSGNAWPRRMLERILPMPEDDFGLCADAYLLAAAPMFGEIRTISEPQSCYRLHDGNNYWNRPFAQALSRGVETYELQSRAASQMLARKGIVHDPARWISHSWWHRLRDAVSDILGIVPPGQSFILADDDQWGTPYLLDGRRRIAFPQKNGRYSGPPATDEDALRTLRELKQQGANYLIFGWPAMWYLDHYAGLAVYLSAHARCVLRNGRVVGYDLRENP